MKLKQQASRLKILFDIIEQRNESKKSKKKQNKDLIEQKDNFEFVSKASLRHFA
jgi:hypothetical protein